MKLSHTGCSLGGTQQLVSQRRTSPLRGIDGNTHSDVNERLIRDRLRPSYATTSKTLSIPFKRGERKAPEETDKDGIERTQIYTQVQNKPILGIAGGGVFFFWEIVRCGWIVHGSRNVCLIFILFWFRAF